MKVYVYPADLYGCGYLRLIWPAQVLQALGHDVVIVTATETMDAFGKVGPVADLEGKVDEKGKTIAVNAPADADVIVLQRVTHRGLSEAVPLWKSQGIAVVIDVDDDLSCIHPSNPAFYILHPKYGNLKFSWEYTMDACRDATLVTVSTPALAERYAPHGRSHVLYNRIPAKHLDIPHEDSRVIGWGGSAASHPDDLQVVGSTISTLTEEGNSFCVVGPDSGIEDALRLKENWSATGSVTLHQWPRTVAAKIGIGIAPLSDTKFNHAKSWLKPLEYASLGIPFVASPRTEYQRLNKTGIGILAKKPRNWEKAIRSLLCDSTLRKEMSLEGRDVARDLTIEGHAWRWWEAWQKAYDMR